MPIRSSGRADLKMRLCRLTAEKFYLVSLLHWFCSAIIAAAAADHRECHDHHHGQECQSLQHIEFSFSLSENKPHLSNFSKLRMFGMKHGGDCLFQHVVLPDLLPVVTQHMTITDTKGNVQSVVSLNRWLSGD